MVPQEHRAARERYEALRECGVEVKVAGWPKIVRQYQVTPDPDRSLPATAEAYNYFVPPLEDA